MQFPNTLHEGVDTIIGGFHEKDFFGFVADLVLPAVNRTHAGNDVASRDERFFHQLAEHGGGHLGTAGNENDAHGFFSRLNQVFHGLAQSGQKQRTRLFQQVKVTAFEELHVERLRCQFFPRFEFVRVGAVIRSSAERGDGER